MVNAYVKDDNRLGNDSHHHDSDDEFCMDNDVMDIHDWEAFYSQDLQNVWNRMKGYAHESGAGAYMLLYCEWSSFVRFCYENSSQRKYWAAVGHD